MPLLPEVFDQLDRNEIDSNWGHIYESDLAVQIWYAPASLKIKVLLLEMWFVHLRYR
jgi:hypothetical protein